MDFESNSLMLEQPGDVWSPYADAYVVTTCGDIVRHELVMGAGIARQAKELYPQLPLILARLVARFGNKPFIVPMSDHTIMTMPTKHSWRQPSDLKLVRESADYMQQLATMYDMLHVAMPRAGCGLGGLSWEDVQPELDARLGNRFTVYA